MTNTGSVTIAGKPLVCGHCGNRNFITRRARMDAVSTFLDFSWLFESARVYVCTGCGQLLWFLRQSDVATMSAGAADKDYEIECLQCGSVMPAGESTCAECGWTYEANA